MPAARRAPPRTVGEILRWSYANLAMAHAAVHEGAQTYAPRHYAVRSCLHAGLGAGTMQMGPLVDDERLKLVLPQACGYCGAREQLTADHVISLRRGGPDTDDNLIWACRSCNSSKGMSDLLVWLERKGTFAPLLLLRRYLKLAFVIAEARGAVDLLPSDAAHLPVSLETVPLKYPAPAELRLWVIPF